MGILIEGIRRVGMVGAKIQRRNAVADIIVLVGVFVQRRVLDCVRKLVAAIVAVDVVSRFSHARAATRHLRAASDSVVHVVVLRDDVAERRVLDLSKQVARQLIRPVRTSCGSDSK